VRVLAAQRRSYMFGLCHTLVADDGLLSRSDTLCCVHMLTFMTKALYPLAYLQAEANTLWQAVALRCHCIEKMGPTYKQCLHADGWWAGGNLRCMHAVLVLCTVHTTCARHVPQATTHPRATGSSTMLQASGYCGTYAGLPLAIQLAAACS
jgi:hypothetical protein